MRLRHVIPFVVLCLSPTPPGALTIYQVGGGELPDAESFGAPTNEIDFVRVTWDEAWDGLFGSVHLVDVQADSLRPVFVNSANLMGRAIEMGGYLKARFPGYQLFKFDEDMVVIHDGDPETTYPGNQPPFEAESELRISGSPFCIDTPSRVWTVPGGNYCKYIHLNLPGAFPLQQIRIYPAPGNEARRFIPRYTLGVSDGDPLKFGRQDRTFGYTGGTGRIDLEGSFDVVSEESENVESLLEFGFQDKPVKEVVFMARIGDWEIAEFETIFNGFAVNSNFTSTTIDLGTSATVGPVNWGGHLHPGSAIDLRVRAGNSTDPNVYYRNTFRGNERTRFDFEGDLLTRRAYLRLEAGEQGGIAPDLDNWSHWSERLEFSRGEAPPVETAPRRYVQFVTDFNSGGRLDYLQFAVTQPPVVTIAKAEIEPGRVPARQSERFSYLITPSISVGDLGFDTIEIETPTAVDSVVAVAVNRATLDPSQWQATIGDSSLVVSIPRMNNTNTGELVEIVFYTHVFDFGTTFSGSLFDSERPWEVHQRLQPGDADLVADSNSLTVELVDVEARILGDLSFSTPVLTPNGDGVNDVLAVDFDLVNLSIAVPVSIEVFNLSGDLVGGTAMSQLASGPHRVEWGGRDFESDLLPPGTYILRLSAETDGESISVDRIISVAY